MFSPEEEVHVSDTAIESKLNSKLLINVSTFQYYVPMSKCLYVEYWVFRCLSKFDLACENHGFGNI